MGAVFLQAAGPSISQGRRIDECFACAGSIYFGHLARVWVGVPSWARQGAAPGSLGPASSLTSPPGWVSCGGLVDQSGFPNGCFGESRCFASTGAVFLQAAGPSISQERRIDERFICTRNIFWGLSGSHLGRGAQLGSTRGGLQVPPAGIKVRKVVFCVAGNMPFTKSGRFTYTGSPFPLGIRPSSFPARSLDEHFGSI